MMTVQFDNTAVTIDLDAITANFQAVSDKAGVPVMAIIKADAYGHGAVTVARQLQAGCAFFGVSSMAEALELRKAGIAKPILILGRMSSVAYATAISQGIRPTIFRYEDALELSKAAQALDVDAPFHLAVDTGMSRIGFQVAEADADVCAQICRLPRLIPEGLFSHLATADEADLTGACAQREKFDMFVSMLEQRGVQVQLRHLDNSAGIMNFDNHYEMVRAGIALYGLYPSGEVDPKLLPLRPALRWTSRVTHVKMLEAGRQVSYGGTFVVQKPTMVATVPVGYADGYKRSLSGKFYVLIHGQPALILGRVCMDQIMVDVTDISNVAVNDQVVLIGTDGNRTITVEEIAAAAGSFHYEFVCGIGRRVPRFYQKDGKIVQKVHYLLDL